MKDNLSAEAKRLRSIMESSKKIYDVQTEKVNNLRMQLREAENIQKKFQTDWLDASYEFHNKAKEELETS